jgi:hypothetical protein
MAGANEGAADDLLDIDAASDLLGMPADRVMILVEQGLLNPEDEAGSPVFRRAELLALREQGG